MIKAVIIFATCIKNIWENKTKNLAKKLMLSLRENSERVSLENLSPRIPQVKILQKEFSLLINKCK